MKKEEKTEIFVKKLKIWGENSGFSLKTQHGGSLRLLSGAPQPLKEKPGLTCACVVEGVCKASVLLVQVEMMQFCGISR